MIPTNLFAALVLSIAALDPQALRQELDSAPWHPAPGSVPAKASTDSPAHATPSPKDAVSAPASDTPHAPQSVRIDGRAVWQLQLAALANPDVAKREQARLEKELGVGTVALVQENNLLKLRWGSFSSREGAEAARTELKAHRLDGFPVKTSSSP